MEKHWKELKEEAMECLTDTTNLGDSTLNNISFFFKINREAAFLVYFMRKIDREGKRADRIERRENCSIRPHEAQW